MCHGIWKYTALKVFDVDPRSNPFRAACISTSTRTLVYLRSHNHSGFLVSSRISLCIDDLSTLRYPSDLLPSHRSLAWQLSNYYTMPYLNMFQKKCVSIAIVITKGDRLLIIELQAPRIIRTYS
jgi:hypothetical protein